MKTVALFAAFVALMGICLPSLGSSYQAEGDGVRVVVYDEDCKLKGQITNLNKRATWTEQGKTTEGCAGVHPMGLVMLYFADRTVVVIPVQQFVRVTNA